MVSIEAQINNKVNNTNFNIKTRLIRYTENIDLAKQNIKLYSVHYVHLYILIANNLVSCYNTLDVLELDYFLKSRYLLQADFLPLKSRKL